MSQKIKSLVLSRICLAIMEKKGVPYPASLFWGRSPLEPVEVAGKMTKKTILSRERAKKTLFVGVLACSTLASTVVGAALRPLAPRDPAATSQALFEQREALVDLRDSGEIQFANPDGSRQFDRIMRRLDRETARLDSTLENECGTENYRGRATLVIRQIVGRNLAPAIIAHLPRLVTSNDLEFIKLVCRIHTFQAADIIGGYAAYPSRFTDFNKKGDAAIYLLERFDSVTLVQVLSTLPEYISGGELDSFKLVVNYTTPSKLSEVLREFFGT